MHQSLLEQASVADSADLLNLLHSCREDSALKENGNIKRVEKAD